jgi:NADH-quinone oxidoreductase subunit F
MALSATSAPPTFDLTPLRPVLERYASQGRAGLLPVLHAAQSIYGCLSEPVADAVGRALRVPLADVHGVIDFYAMFYREPVGVTLVRVCGDPACALAGSDAVQEAVCRHLGVGLDETTADGAFTVERAPCLGLCEHAPALLVGEAAIGRADPAKAADLCLGKGQPISGLIGGDARSGILSQNCGHGHPTRLAEYGDYAALRKALATPPEAVIAEIKASGLVGRGGAAFPTGVKWEGAARASGQPKYVVCNADESEPGTFKDRVIMEEDPHRAIEGLAISAYAIGAHKGYFYIRGEYPYAFAMVSEAVQAASQTGYLGKNIFGSGFDFEIEMRMGAGAYICGEETALFESIEGRRGFPRIKPPFPTTHGLFGKPTVINNVETLCNVPLIIAQGAAEYRKIGTEKSPGPKLFCVSGQVQRPGLYEVPFGVTMRHLLYDLAGGLRPGRSLQAVLFGGAAGAFATEKDLDVKMSFEDLRAAGLPLGSGVVMVFDDTADMRDVLYRLARFFAHESCGKCYPCQLGTQRQMEILERAAHGHSLAGDLARLTDVGWTMTDASLCGLGQTAASAVLSAVKLWPELFDGRRTADGGRT